MANYLRPHGLEEALGALQRPFTVLAGGTDFYPARVGRTIDEDVLDISAIADLRGISATSTGWRLGATATWGELIAAELPPLFNGLKQAARDVGGRSVRAPLLPLPLPPTARHTVVARPRDSARARGEAAEESSPALMRS